MRTQTGSLVVGSLLPVLWVLLLAPLQLACARRIRGAANRNEPEQITVIPPEDNSWQDKTDTRAPGKQLHGPFWDGCGRVRSFDDPYEPWPVVLPGVNETVPYTNEELGFDEDIDRRSGGGGGHSRGANLGDNLRSGTEFPPHVSIINDERGYFDHKCGGVIIADRLVLTDKFCVDHVLDSNNFTKMFLFASFRTWNANETDMNWSNMGQIREVSNICLGVDLTGPGVYRRAEYALIRTTKPFCFNQRVWSACLPDRQYHEKERARFRPHRNLYQVGNGIEWTKAKDKHLRVGYKGVRLTSCHKTDGPQSKFEVCYAEYYKHNRWSRVCRGDVGAGLYVVERNDTNLNSVYNKLTVLSTVGMGNDMQLWQQNYCSIPDVTSKMDWWYSTDIYEEMVSGPLVASIQLCAQGLYGYPLRDLQPVTWT